MTRTNTTHLPRLGLVAVAVLMLAAPASALPDLPLDVGGGAATPFGSADAALSGASAQSCAAIGGLPIDAAADGCIDADPLEGSVHVSACTDAAASADDVSSAAMGAMGTAGGALGPAGSTVSGATGALGPASGALGAASGATSALPPAAAAACAEAGVEEGGASAAADASAGPVQQAFGASIDALKDAWKAVRGLF